MTSTKKVKFDARVIKILLDSWSNLYNLSYIIKAVCKSFFRAGIATHPIRYSHTALCLELQLARLRMHIWPRRFRSKLRCGEYSCRFFDSAVIHQIWKRYGCPIPTTKQKPFVRRDTSQLNGLLWLATRKKDRWGCTHSRYSWQCCRHYDKFAIILRFLQSSIFIIELSIKSWYT